MRFFIQNICRIVLASTLAITAQTTVTTNGGSTGSIPKFDGTSSVTTSTITEDSSGRIGINTAPSAGLDVHRELVVHSDQNGQYNEGIRVNDADNSWAILHLGGSAISGTGNGQWDVVKMYDGTFGIGSQSNYRFTVLTNGNVGIGTLTPSATLDINGNVKVSGSGASITFPDNTVQSTAWNGTTCGGDYAESVEVAGEQKTYEPGDVIVVDDQGPNGSFRKSSDAYSTLVAGIYSTKPGLTGRRLPVDKPKDDEVPMAMVGIVPTKVSTENGPIRKGDLLVTSSQTGYAMRGTDRTRMVGAIVGKALEPLATGNGVIEVLVTLQ